MKKSCNLPPSPKGGEPQFRSRTPGKVLGEPESPGGDSRGLGVSGLLGLPPGSWKGREPPSPTSAQRDPKKEVPRLRAALPGRRARAPERAGRAPSPPRRPERAHGRGAPARPRPGITHTARASRLAPTTASADGPGLQSVARLPRLLPSCSRRSVPPGFPLRPAGSPATTQLRIAAAGARTPPRHGSPLPAPVANRQPSAQLQTLCPPPLPTHWPSWQPVKEAIGQLEFLSAPTRARPRPRAPPLVCPSSMPAYCVSAAALL